MPNQSPQTAPTTTMAALTFGDPARPIDIIFLHANGFNAGTYRHVLAPLSTDLRILAPDMRGHGRTTLPAIAENHTWATYADDLLALLATLPAMPRVLAGHSMGATTCLLAAARLPAENLPKLVLFDPVVAPLADYAGPPPPAYDVAIARAAARRTAVFASRDAAFDQYKNRGAFRTWPDAILRDYLHDGFTPTADGQVTLSCTPAWETANFAAYAQSNPYPALCRPNLNLRIFRASNGSTFNPDMQALPPNLPIETIPSTTHFIPMERPDLVQQALRAAAGSPPAA